MIVFLATSPRPNYMHLYAALTGQFSVVHHRTHCVFEAVVSVDVSVVGGQFDPMTHTDAPPLGRREISGRDTVHLPCFMAFIDHRLLAEPQPAIILTTNTNSIQRSFPARLRYHFLEISSCIFHILSVHSQLVYEQVSHICLECHSLYYCNKHLTKYIVRKTVLCSLLYI